MSLDDITQHLSGQCPNDSECILDLPLKHADARQWGHWDFVTDTRAPGASSLSWLSGTGTIDSEAQAELNVRANQYLEGIRKLYRLTLQFYFIRQNLVRTAQVANVFGEIWVYGDPVGRAVLDELLTMVAELTQNHHKAVTDFWKDYFVEGYMPHAREMREDDGTHPCHIWLNKIDREVMPGIEHDVHAIMDTVVLIREQSRKLPQQLERIKKIKKALFDDLLALLKDQGKDKTANYFTIQQALTELEMDVEIGFEEGSIEHAESTVYKEAQKECLRKEKIKQGIECQINAYIESLPEVMIELQKYRQLEQDALQKQAEISQTYTQLLSAQMSAIREAEQAQKDTIKHLAIELHEEKILAQHALLGARCKKKQVVAPDDEHLIASEDGIGLHGDEPDSFGEKFMSEVVRIEAKLTLVEALFSAEASSKVGLN